MKRILCIVSILLAFALPGWAATYTVCAEGCDYTTIQDVFNGRDLAPDDIIEIRADSVGGSKTYSEMVTVGSNDMGSEGHPLIIRSRSGDTITIDGGANANALVAYYEDYITVQNIAFTGGTSATVRVRTNAGVDEPIGWTFDNCTVSGGSANGLQIDGGSGHTISNSTISATARPIYAITTGLTITGCTVTGGSAGGVIIRNGSQNIVATNTTASGSGAGAHGWSFTGTTGTNSLTSCQGNSNGGQGFYIYNSSGFTLTSCSAANNTASGYVINGTSATVTLNNCSATGNDVDGFATDNSANTVTYNRCIATGNGVTSPTTEGDGFTAHLTNHAIKLNYCIASGNYNTGAAMIGTSSGEINNCVFYGNGEAGGPRAGLYLPCTDVNPTSGVSWTVKNTIVMDNLPREVWFGADVDDDIVSDNNCYYHTAGGDMFTVDGGAHWVSFATFQSAMMGQEPAAETHSINADPKFRSATDFRLSVSSPCINAGTDVSLTSDYDGKPVPVGTAPDIGAYVYKKAGSSFNKIIEPYYIRQ